MVPAFLLGLFLAASAPGGAFAVAVTSAMPEGTVRDLTQITVRFNEAMHPLGAASVPAKDAPLELTAVHGALPAGNFRWLDPMTLAYIFDAPVRHPLTIRAVVPRGTASLAGSLLEAEKSWTIATPPLVLEHDVRDEKPLPRTGGQVYLRANYPVDREKLREKIRMTVGDKAVPFTIAAPQVDHSRGRPAVWRYRLDVTRALPPDSTVHIAVAEGVTAEEGGQGTGAYAFSLPTYTRLRLESWEVRNPYTGVRYTPGGSLAAPPPEGDLVLHFNNPVRRKDALAHVTIAPTANQPEEDPRDPDFESPSVVLPRMWRPRTAYTATVRPGLKDAYGTTLAKAEKIAFTTGDFRPLIYMPGGTRVMETPLGHIFPLTVRNPGNMRVLLRHLPWGSEAFAALDKGRGGEDRAPAKTPAAWDAVIDLADAAVVNENTRLALDLPDALGFASPAEARGLILLSLQFEGDAAAKKLLEENFQPVWREALLQITDLGVALRLGETRGIALVTGITSGKPVSGAEVRIADISGTTVWRGKTGENGIAATPGHESLPDGPLFCIVSEGNDVSVLPLAASGIPEKKTGRAPQEQHRTLWRIHTVAQLPLYQPGQTVNATVYVRAHTSAPDGKADDDAVADWRAVADETLRVTVADRRGRTVHAFEAATNAYGSVSFSFPLPPDAEPGWYRVTAKSEHTDREMTAMAFQAASFRPPDFKVDITPPPSQPRPEPATPLSVAVRAGYFSGAAMPGAEVLLHAVREDSYFAPPRLNGYKTGPDIFPYWRGQGVPRDSQAAPETVSGRLDATGAASLSLPPAREKLRYPQNISLTATVTDAARLTSQGAASFMLHPGEYYVGLRSPFIALPGQKALFTLKAATWDDKPVIGKNVSLTARRVTRDTEKPAPPVWEKTVRLTDDSGDGTEAVFAESGEYIVTARIIDDAGRENVAASRVYVPGKGMDWIRSRSGDHLELLVAEQTYTPGDAARIVVKNPFDRATALVCVERDEVLRFEIREVSGPSPVIDIPLDAADAPYVYVSVTLITGRTAEPPGSGAPEGAVDEGAPAYAQGAVRLAVSGKENRLSVAVATDAAEYLPGGTVTAKVAVTDAGGVGKKTQVTLLAVDERVLRAAGENTLYDPAGTFGPLFSHNVRSAALWPLLMNRNLPTPDVASLRYKMPRPAMAALDTRTAAGNGGAEPLRSDFSPLAFWLAAHETDDEGTLTATFTLPDTLTGYRVIAVAADTGSGFGVGEHSIRAALPLQLLSALPKFVTEGDTLMGGILVQNMSGKPGTATVTARAGGARLADAARTVRLDAGASGTVYFPLHIDPLAEEEGEVRLSVTGELNGETDAVRFTLPVKPARPMTTVAASGVLAKGESFTLPVTIPAGPDPRSRLDVTLAPSPAAGIPMAAKQVYDYPWNCLEQRLSRSWARILRIRHGAFLRLPPDATDREKITADLRAVPEYQRQDGSFVPWVGMRHSDNALFLAAYALVVDGAAREIGMSLPEKTVAGALGYIEKNLTAPPSDDADRNGDAAAFSLYALSRHKPDAARALFPAILARCEAGEANPLGWGSLLLALDALSDGAAREVPQRRIIANLEKTAAVTATELHFASAYEHWHWRTMGSRLRDNAMVLGALAVALPEYPRLEALARWVGQSVGDKATLSTQEAVFGVWGLATYLARYEGEGDTAVRAVWNGKDEISATFTALMDPPVVWTIPAEKLHGENATRAPSSGLVLSAAKGAPYWTVRLAYASQTLPVRAENAGFAITRKVSGDGTWNMGDTVTVTLTLTVPTTRRHVLLFDPFPAGLEPPHATRVDIRERETQWQQPWQWQDALDDGMLLYTPVVHPGTYVYTYTLRAAAPGSFVQRPAYVEEMYTPEVFGRTTDGRVTVK